MSGAEQGGVPIRLWPAGLPALPGSTEKFSPGPEQDMTTAKDGLVAGKAVIRTGNVTEPSLTFYPAPVQNNSGATVVVFPGGGYRILAFDLEGNAFGGQHLPLSTERAMHFLNALLLGAQLLLLLQ